MEQEHDDDEVPERAEIEEVADPSLASPCAVASEPTDPFGNYVDDLPVWLQRQASSGALLTAEPSESQEYTAVLSAALAEVAALREQLAVQAAVSQQAKEDAAKATAAATEAKAELLAHQIAIERERAASLSLSSASSNASSVAPSPHILPGKEADKEASKEPSSSAAEGKVMQQQQQHVRRDETEEEPLSDVEVEVQLTLQDALDELSSMSDKWVTEERDMKATLKKRGSEQKIPIEQLSTLIEAKLLAAQYAFERDEAMQRSRRMRSELDHLLKRVPAEEVATGA